MSADPWPAAAVRLRRILERTLDEDEVAARLDQLQRAFVAVEAEYGRCESDLLWTLAAVQADIWARRAAERRALRG